MAGEIFVRSVRKDFGRHRLSQGGLVRGMKLGLNNDQRSGRLQRQRRGSERQLAIVQVLAGRLGEAAGGDVEIDPMQSS